MTNISKNIFRGLTLAALAAATTVAPGCNSDTETENYYEAADLSAVTVQAFSLQADNKVLNNLDSVYFAIDLANFRIFNPDSLPKGTRIDSIAVTMSTAEVSVAEFRFRIYGTGRDTTLNFLEKPNEAINFADGPVVLHMESLDGSNKRDYEVKLNVHRMSPDSLYWAEAARRDLPTSLPLSSVAEQRTVRFEGKALCLTADTGGNYSLAVADEPSGRWELATPQVARGALRVGTLTAADSSLYALSPSGQLLSSPDGVAWSEAGAVWQTITAPYGTGVLGIERRDGAWLHAAYPPLAMADATVAEDFPLSGNSQAVTLATKWAERQQVITAGGRDRNGSLTGATWAFDGSRWAKIGGGLPAAEGYAVTPYKICKTDTLSWSIVTTDVLLAIGGRADSCQRAVYLSKDMGMNWHRADREVQLPDYIPATYGADALVFEQTLHSRSASLPLGSEWRRYFPATSRAVAPITEWECPYLYLFGGVTDQGALQPALWRGVINHLAFKPLQ